MHSILYMSTLLTLGISISNAFNAIYTNTVNTVFTPHSTLYNTSVDSVDKHSIQCIACFDLHIDSVGKQDTPLNTQ